MQDRFFLLFGVGIFALIVHGVPCHEVFEDVSDVQEAIYFEVNGICEYSLILEGPHTFPALHFVSDTQESDNNTGFLWTI
jgi:hypothetical protein